MPGFLVSFIFFYRRLTVAVDTTKSCPLQLLGVLISHVLEKSDMKKKLVRLNTHLGTFLGLC